MVMPIAGFVKDMQTHIAQEMRLPESVSPEAFLERKERLLKSFEQQRFCLQGTNFTAQDLDIMKVQFERHIAEFRTRYNLPQAKELCQKAG